MAADILAVQSTVVPVGRDQKQNVEVTRDIATKFNNKFGEVFTIPEPSIRNEVAVVPGIDGQKMSKSYDNHIEIFGGKKATRKRIMRIVTDSTPLEEPKDPEVCNVYALYKLFASPAELEDMAQCYRSGGFGYGDAKKRLLEAVTNYFDPLRAKREELEKNLDFVESVLQKGAEKARATAGATLKAARQAMGLE
jgi:tryptophanyl-tRNA synthetase